MTELLTHNGIIFKLHHTKDGIVTVVLRPEGVGDALWSIAGAYTEWVANKRWKDHGFSHDPFTNNPEDKDNA